MHYKKIISLLSALLFLGQLLAACQPATPAFTPDVKPTATPAPTKIVPTPTVTLPPSHTLVVCLGQEPSSLYLYNNSSRSTWSVLEAIYDGPIDTRQFSYQPVILQKIPSFSDGDATIQPVDVQSGQDVVDTDGSLVNLTKGTRVFPAGCSKDDCAVDWDGASQLQMDQMTATFTLKPGIKWADGAPLTAADSVYSFQVASDPATNVKKDMVDNTASYEATDDLTVKWMGKPGFLTRQFDTIFWIPLPKHAWEQTNPADLAKSDIANRTPLGWGPFMVQEWVIGDHITLQKNPNYFRASEGLPKFDTLVYRFLGEPSDGNLAALLTGECDVVDQTSLLDEQLEAVVELQQSKKLKAYIGQGPEWEHLDFGINPASTDKGTEANARPDFFSDLRTRQAFAYCIDRQAIVDKLLLGQSTVPASYYPPSHPLFMPDLTPLAHDVSAGRRLLDEVGWKVAGGDPQQPRQALGVPNVPDGTPLTVSYYTTEAALRVEVAKQLSSNLAECGIHLNVSYINPGELYATGPNGVLFGRNFDLAQFSWGIGPRPACVLYTSGQIPTASNNWLGSNITGFRDPNYDAACRAALQARPDQPDAYKQADQQAQRIFAEQLPSIPLFYRLKIAVSQPDLCGMQMDVTARSDLWNLESFEIGKNCK